MSKILDYIFIDTSVFQKERFFKETGRVSKLLELAENGYIRILLPIITKIEWLKHFKNEAILNIKSSEVEKKLALLGNDKFASDFIKKYRTLLGGYDSPSEIDRIFNDKISNNGIIHIDYPYFEDRMADVFDKYFKKEKPFGTGGKSKEFPDAFVLASLEKYAKENMIKRVVLLSADKGMTEYVSPLLNVMPISEFLNDLVQKRIPDANEEAKRKDIEKLYNYIHYANPKFESDLSDKVENYLSDMDHYMVHFSFADIDDISDINFSLDITEKDMDILSVSDEIIEAVCYPEIDGTVLVSHFVEEDSLWNSEEKEWIYKTYAPSEVEISSYFPVTVRMYRNEVENGQYQKVEIVDVDFRPLQDSLDDDDFE